MEELFQPVTITLRIGTLMRLRALDILAHTKPSAIIDATSRTHAEHASTDEYWLYEVII